jgi:dihydrofolate synthase/folylpolyglutamate synthase
MSRPTTLALWLGYLETLHPKSIAMGLDRVRAVYDRMHIALACVVITVDRNQRQGSTCAMLAAMLRAGGFRVGLYTSPHLTRYNERVAITMGSEASDGELVTALNAVEDARIDGADGVATELTYFEFGTLAALWLFARVNSTWSSSKWDWAAGSMPSTSRCRCGGGDQRCADHMDYWARRARLSAPRKPASFAGIAAVCAEPDPPTTMTDHASALERRLLYRTRLRLHRIAWAMGVLGPGGDRSGLAHPALRGPINLPMRPRRSR